MFINLAYLTTTVAFAYFLFFRSDFFITPHTKNDADLKKMQNSM